MDNQTTKQTAIAHSLDANSPSSTPSIRATKRKLDDAFQVLDDAVGSTDILRRPSPPKKTHAIRSLYSTLAKYGIRSKEPRDPSPSHSEEITQTFSKNTPHLTAILTRAATRTRKALPFRFSGPSTSPAPALSPTADYRPSSIPAFLSRLSTFKLATYANKPPAIDAVAASKCGWTNGGKDRLVCGLCNSSWVVAGREGMSRDAANALIEKQRVSLVDMHKNGCPWKTRQCDPTIYRIPLQSPPVMVRNIKSDAIALEDSLRNVEVKHPLAANQLNPLRSTILSFSLPSPTEQNDPGRDYGDVFMSGSTESSELSDAAILTSLFGWVLVPPEPRRTSLSRANSLTPSAPPTPGLSRSASVTYQRPAPNTPFSFRMPLNVSKEKHDSTLLQCPLCQRRVGLWAFTSPSSENGTTHELPQIPPPPNGDPATAASPGATIPAPPPAKKTLLKRQFDLLKEHRSYCPYVVRSTLVPSLPLPPSASTVYGHTRSSSTSSQLNGQTDNGEMEGWRAVLMVLLRYGKAQRQRMGLNYLGAGSTDIRESENEGTSMEVDGVKAMVAGVKSRGGKDLLRYVKGLLS